jgi:hypothetical protein
MTDEDQRRIAFENFDAAHSEIWTVFLQFTFQLIRAGHNHYSARAVLHRIRWHMAVDHPVKTAFKVNNNHSAFYARKFHRRYPIHAGFFRTRTARRKEVAP